MASGGGRGRAGMSFNVEQLGFKAGEALPGPVLQPPPSYPTLEFYPAQLETNSSYDEKLEFKTSLLNYLNSSSAYVPMDEVEKGLGNLMNMFTTKIVPNCSQLDYDWSMFPSELRPSSKKKGMQRKGGDFKVPNKVSRMHTPNVTTLFDELEKREEADENNEELSKEIEVKKEVEEGEGGVEKEDGEEEDLDEEMDDGTDYNMDYFDNGEGYLDEEDDNLDDGPIY